MEKMLGRKKFGDGNRAEDSVKWDVVDRVPPREEIEIAIRAACSHLSDAQIYPIPRSFFPHSRWILVA